MKIPYLSFEFQNQLIRKEIIQSFESFFDSGWYVLGENVKKFESAYASANRVRHCIGVSNGLDALHLSLKALNIGKGDEVIVPSNTYIATALAVSYVGAVPVFVEPKLNTYNIDPEKIEQAITSSTKAIMPVHLYGQACEMDAIMEIAKKHQLYVIEDNAQSQLASFNGKLTGSFGHLNGTSFYPGKNLGALGDAGAITTDDQQLADEVRMLRNYGSQKKYFNDKIGFNMRLDECQAGFLSVKLNYLERWTKERQLIASYYDEALSGIGGITLPERANGATHVYHIYPIRSSKRDRIQEYLSGEGIGTMIHYPIPPHLQKAYAYLGFKKGDFPIAEEIADTCLSLPIWPGMTENEVRFISEKIKNYL